jgi:hypothetical protein
LPPTILASDAVQRLFDELFVIVMPWAAIVNLGQIDGRHVCISVDCSVLFISSCLAALSFPCVLTSFYWIYVHNPAGLRASQGISSHAAPTVGAAPRSLDLSCGSRGISMPSPLTWNPKILFVDEVLAERRRCLPEKMPRANE